MSVLSVCVGFGTFISIRWRFRRLLLRRLFTTFALCARNWPLLRGSFAIQARMVDGFSLFLLVVPQLTTINNPLNCDPSGNSCKQEEQASYQAPSSSLQRYNQFTTSDQTTLPPPSPHICIAQNRVAAVRRASLFKLWASTTATIVMSS